MIKQTLAALALATLIAAPALADDGVMPQQSKVTISNDTQTGVGAGKGAFSGKKHVMHHGKKAHHKGHHKMMKKAK